MIWRCRFDSSTTSKSTMPSVPTPAAARYSSAGEPRPPAPDAQHLGVLQAPLPGLAHVRDDQVPGVAPDLVHGQVVSRGDQRWQRHGNSPDGRSRPGICPASQTTESTQAAFPPRLAPQTMRRTIRGHGRTRRAAGNVTARPVQIRGRRQSPSPAGAGPHLAAHRRRFHAHTARRTARRPVRWPAGQPRKPCHHGGRAAAARPGSDPAAPVPDSAPPYDDELAAGGRSARRSGPAQPGRRPASGAPRAGSPPEPAVPAGGHRRRAGAGEPRGWPGQFAQVLAETLAGARPPRQLVPWTTERATAASSGSGRGSPPGQPPRSAGW